MARDSALLTAAVAVGAHVAGALDVSAAVALQAVTKQTLGLCQAHSLEYIKSAYSRLKMALLTQMYIDGETFNGIRLGVRGRIPASAIISA